MTADRALKWVLAFSLGLLCTGCAGTLIFPTLGFFLPILLGLLVIVTLIAGDVLGAVSPPALRAPVLLVAALLLPLGGALLPIGAATLETRLRLSPPTVPGLRIVSSRPQPFRGSSLSGPRPAVLITYGGGPSGGAAQVALRDTLLAEGWYQERRAFFRNEGGTAEINPPDAIHAPGQVMLRLSGEFVFVSPALIGGLAVVLLGRAAARRRISPGG